MHDQEVIDRWLARDPDPETREELRELIGNDDFAELKERFSRRLAFGTAGLRGYLGAGPSRMNRLVVQETTAGLADYLAEAVVDAKTRGVVVGFDARRKSDVFAEDVARVLAAKGFKVHLATKPVPTPLVAFGVLEMQAAAGVVITASHNPPEYNGYKVFWRNGAQIVPPYDHGIAAAIKRASTLPIPRLESEEAWDDHVSRFGEDLEKIYLEKTDGLSISDARENRQGFRLVFTPLHGVAADLVEAVLERSGFEDVKSVPSQREPDGSFPTVRFPNPEEPGAMDAVIEMAVQRSAHLALASDPDGDRLAVAARREGHPFALLTGDQVGALLGNYVLQHDSKVCVATTIVSSQLLEKLAIAHGATYFETLTGFKWIANGAIDRLRDHGTRFAFGYEEALGYTLGELVRDKDGISAIRIFCEMAADLHAEGRTVLDELERIYREHGVYVTTQRSVVFEPNDPARLQVMTNLRSELPDTIADRKVSVVEDLKTRRRRVDGVWTPHEELPESNVLIFRLEDGARVIVRPSGTEPKIKCYYEVRGDVGQDFQASSDEARSVLQSLVERHQVELFGSASAG